VRRGVWKKRKEQVEEIYDIERGRFWGVTFFHNTKPSSFEELKNCIGGGGYIY